MADCTVGDIMTRQVVYLPAEATLAQAARLMRDTDIGDVVVTDGPNLAGVVTDRDLVIRAVAEQRDVDRTPIIEVTSRRVVMVDQGSAAGEAARLMREHAVRRLLVRDVDGSLVGVVSLGDLTRHLDGSSALGEISERSPAV